MDDTDALERVTGLLGELQQAARAKDHPAARDLLTEDVVLMGTGATCRGRADAADYLALLFEETGYVRWDWDTVAVVDSRPGAISFVGLGSVGFADDPASDVRHAFRLTCLLVEEADRWRLRLFHGSVPLE